ncbi:MAG TPA: hypothetical protein VFE58_17325 [Tepidisphaeraceae bacterium]|nr:hypothetical protein [Tepidisphaeraceae bacterium]
MKNDSRPLFVGLSIFVLMLCANAGASAPYEVTPVGSFTPSWAWSLNDSGAVLFSTGATDTTPQRAYVWQGGIAQEIPTASSLDTVGLAMNNMGVVAGVLTACNGIQQGFIWNASEGLTTLNLPGTDDSEIRGINNQSQVVGAAANSVTGQYNAFVWSSSSGATILASLGSGESLANSINNAGQIVGSSGDPVLNSYPFDPNASLGQQHAVMWQNGAVIDLTPSSPWSEAIDVNDRGQVVGYRMSVVLFDGGFQAFSVPFVWDSIHGAVDLPLVGDQASAVAINDEGEIVGYSGNGDADARAILWQGGSVYDLNTLLPENSGWILQYAMDINNLGEIAGVGMYEGQEQSFLLAPTSIAITPEPAFCGVFVLGAFGLRPLRKEDKRDCHGY